MKKTLVVALLSLSPLFSHAQMPTARASCQLTGHTIENPSVAQNKDLEVGGTYCQVLAETELVDGLTLSCIERYQESSEESLCTIDNSEGAETQTVHIEFME